MDVPELANIGEVLASAEVSLPADATLTIAAKGWSVTVAPDATVGPAGQVSTNADNLSARVLVSSSPTGKQEVAGGFASERGGIYTSVANEIGEDGDRHLMVQVHRLEAGEG